MNQALLGLYSLFLFAVVFRGNGEQFVAALGEDSKRFGVWLAAIVVLVMLHESEKTRPIVAPFAALLVLNTVLRNWESISNQFSDIFTRTTGQTNPFKQFFEGQ